jgi:C_GCAxxG_C_C family probable redox protein
MQSKNQGDRPGRRQFLKNSLISVTGLSTLSIVGYGICNTDKLRSLNNILQMGHCAPSVMQTLLELNDIDNNDLVLFSGAMAGGIAGSDMECGCLTSPLMFMSYRSNNLNSKEEKLKLIDLSQKYVREFIARNRSCICDTIRSKGISSCIKTACNFHTPYSRAVSGLFSLSDESKESYTRLFSEFHEKDFHCTQNVLRILNDIIPVTKEELNASWVFLGGIAMLNRTCGALTGGVLALSAATAKMEDSYRKVAKMNRLLRQGRTNEAMTEETNNFNHSILLSDELGAWFRNEFGSTNCFSIWGYNFSKVKDAENFINGRCIKHCKLIAEKVAAQVSTML